ncbi:MAG: LysR family transcriptional regulator [Actinobacteria bacterium]|nr:LysR family transcriptional regulator [Actinomycetota bacterium]
MDLVAACRVFIHVGERGSFTLGAAAARVPQSVASRRIAALEEHFGTRLFDRSARRAALTPFGRDMLPPAKRLVQLAEAMEYHAEQAKLRPFTLAVPATCSVRQLAMLDAAFRDDGSVLDVQVADPGERAEMARSGQVQAALLAVPADGADWAVPLGVAGRANGGAGPLHLGSLRPAREQRFLRRIVIQPEDDVPHIRDPLQQAGHRAALLPAQIIVASSLVAAASQAIRAGNFLLCSAAQAADLGLRWRPLAAVPVARGYRVSALASEDADRVRGSFGPQVAQAVGTPTGAAELA